MNHPLKETACPRSSQGSSLDQRAILPRRMTAAHPRKEPALRGQHSAEYYERRLNPRATRNRTLCRGTDVDVN